VRVETTWPETGGADGSEGALGFAPPVADRPRAAARRRRVRQALAVRVVPPLVAFVFAQVLLFSAAVWDGRASYFLSPGHWIRWDSNIYLMIAGHGYSFYPCAGSLFPPHSSCGTAGWAPLYPGMIWLVAHAGFTTPGAAMALSFLFAYLTLQAVWVLIGPSWSFSKLCCLALASCFPGMVYYYAVFPVSLLTFLTVVCLILFIRHRYLAAGLIGALCAWAFAVGPLIGVVLVVSAVLVDRGPGFWRAVSRSAGVAFAGFALLLLADQWWVGSWRAYFDVQAKYGNGLHDPITTFVIAFVGAPRATYPLQDPNPGYGYLVPKAQTAFVAALVIGLVVWTLRRARQAPVSRGDWVVLSYTVVFWVLPLVDGPSLGRYRLEALLVPCTVLCTRLPRVVQVVLVGTASVLAVEMTSLFTKSLLF
jgi:hypothetical protein